MQSLPSGTYQSPFETHTQVVQYWNNIINITDKQHPSNYSYFVKKNRRRYLPKNHEIFISHLLKTKYFKSKATKYSKNKEDITYEDAYKEVVSKFTELGISEDDIQKAFKKLNSYNNTSSKNFYIESDFNNLEKITNIVANGFRITDTKYLYGKIDDNLETELSLKAIQDAKRKAKTICNDIKMKVGKILNIEVKEGGFSSSTKENKESNTIKTYKVTITFKLID